MSKVRLSIAAALAVMLAFGAFMLYQSANAATSANQMVVDANAGTAGIQANATYTVGQTFKVSVWLQGIVDPYQSYQSKFQYNSAIDGPLSLSETPTENCLGGGSLASSGTITATTIYGGCARLSGTTTAAGEATIWDMKCNGPGTDTLTLLVGGATGSQFGGTPSGTLDATTVNATVTCVLPVHKTSDHGGNSDTAANGAAVTGDTIVYAITVDNPIGTAGDSFTGVIADLLPSGVTYVSDDAGCNTGSLPAVSCIVQLVNPSTTIHITVTVPSSSAGTTQCDSATAYNLSAVQIGQNAVECDVIAPATLHVTKSPAAPKYQAGAAITWNISVTNTGGSAATGVVATDTVGGGWTSTDPNLTNNIGTIPAGGTVNYTVAGTVNTTAPTDLLCHNSLVVTATNGTSNATAATPVTATAACLSKDVRMTKDLNGVLDEPGDFMANLWLCKDPSCPGTNGVGTLTVGEYLANANDDPQGVGAYEFQVKFDNHIFDVSITDSGWLYSTGRVPDDGSALGQQVGGCNATIIQENDIRFGCVSKNPAGAANNTGCLNPDDVTMNADATCGPKNTNANPTALLANIKLTPKADLFRRLTPGNGNGVISSLIDEACEVADIWGHPLSNGFDALGRPIPLPGILPGGNLQSNDCQSFTVTVRLLEGDVNNDCIVDVKDDQAEASRYGAVFGTLLYDPWYDLEPQLKDYDVDIKDLQKVFGRNNSTCANPIPAQDPLPQPGDP